MWRQLLPLFLISLFLPIGALAAGDLAISSSSISFSDELIAGNQVRIYAQVTNNSDEDVSGYVTFYQGTIPIGDSQVISVRAGGLAEEVYVDFVVPSSKFNIRAEIKGTDPEDSNPNNNLALTGTFDPILDDDGDGVANEDDNCPSTSNSSQTDTDGDGLGDACDSDDDGDGWSDSKEAREGTDPQDEDTDDDGVSDPDDFYPLDPTASEERIVVEEPEPEPEPIAEVADEEVIEEESATDDQVVATTISEQDSDEDEEEEVVEEVVETSEFRFSPQALFTYTQTTWNEYEFSVVSPEVEGTIYEWEFGDGVSSQKTALTHTYREFGEFSVKLTVMDQNGEIAQDETTVTVSFFSIENRWVQVILAGLTFILLLGMLIYRRLGRKAKKPKTNTSKKISVRNIEE